MLVLLPVLLEPRRNALEKNDPIHQVGQIVADVAVHEVRLDQSVHQREQVVDQVLKKHVVLVLQRVVQVHDDPAVFVPALAQNVEDCRQHNRQRILHAITVLTQKLLQAADYHSLQLEVVDTVGGVLQLSAQQRVEALDYFNIRLGSG